MTQTNTEIARSGDPQDHDGRTTLGAVMPRKLPPGLDPLPSGKIRARYRDDAGRMHSRSFTGIREAQVWLRGQRADVDRGRHFDPRNPTTVAEAATEWVASRPYRRSSRTRMERHLDHIVDTPLGRLRLVDVRPSDVQAWVGQRSTLLSPSTLRHCYRLIQATFATAVDDRIVPTSPCTRRIALPRAETKRVDALTVEEIAALTDAMPDRYRVLVPIMAGLGLRLGEALGLQVADIDFLRRTVTVARQYTPAREFTPPKSGAGRRTLPVPVHVLDAIAAHLAAYGPGTEGTILSTLAGDPCRHDFVGSRIFRTAAEAAGLDPSVTTHTLRHSYASHLIEGGCSPVLVATLLGHEDPSLTLRVYAHAFGGGDEKARQVLDALHNAPSTPSVRRIHP